MERLKHPRDIPKLFENMGFVTQTTKCYEYLIAMLFIFGWMVMGILHIVAGFVETFESTPSLIQVDNMIIAWMGVLMVSGAFLCLASTLNWQNYSTKWTFEFSGLVLLILAWSIFVIGAAVINSSYVAMISGTVNTIAVSARLYVLQKFVKMTETNVRTFRKEVREAKKFLANKYGEKFAYGTSDYTILTIRRLEANE